MGSGKIGRGRERERERERATREGGRQKGRQAYVLRAAGQASGQIQSLHLQNNGICEGEPLHPQLNFAQDSAELTRKMDALFRIKVRNYGRPEVDHAIHMIIDVEGGDAFLPSFLVQNTAVGLAEWRVARDG